MGREQGWRSRLKWRGYFGSLIFLIGVGVASWIVVDGSFESVLNNSFKASRSSFDGMNGALSFSIFANMVFEFNGLFGLRFNAASVCWCVLAWAIVVVLQLQLRSVIGIISDPAVSADPCLQSFRTI